MTRASTEQQRHTPWFAKAGAASSIVPISRFVGPSAFATKAGDYGVLFSLTGIDPESLTDQDLEAKIRGLEGALRGLPEGFCLYQYTRVRQGFEIRRQDRYSNPVTERFVSDRLEFLQHTAGFRRVDIHWCLLLEAPRANPFERKPQEHSADSSRRLGELLKAASLLEASLQHSIGLTMLGKEQAFQFFTVFGGDTVNWVFDGGHVASRFISVKPKAAGTSTDLHIVSDRGNEYTLQLREVSADADPHFDSKVLITPGDQAGKDRLAAMPVFVPAADLDKAKAEAAAARAAQVAEFKQEEARTEQYRSQYPGTLKFDYTWDRKKGDRLGLQEVWHDGRFTYIRGQFQETPALYELKDGKPSLINFDFANGLYTVPKELTHGYLTIGKKKVQFDRTAEAK